MSIGDLIALALLIWMFRYMTKPHGPTTFTRPRPTTGPPTSYSDDGATHED